MVKKAKNFARWLPIKNDNVKYSTVFIRYRSPYKIRYESLFK